MAKVPGTDLAHTVTDPAPADPVPAKRQGYTIHASTPFYGGSIIPYLPGAAPPVPVDPLTGMPPDLDELVKRMQDNMDKMFDNMSKASVPRIAVKAKPLTRQVSTNGRDWVDYDRLLDADDFELYAHRREV